MINQEDVERYLGRREIEKMELLKRIETLESENKQLRAELVRDEENKS